MTHAGEPIKVPKWRLFHFAFPLRERWAAASLLENYCIECNFSEGNDMELLEAYYGRKATIDEQKYFVAAKLYVDYLWTLWGLTRVPYDGEFMQERD